MPYLPPPIWTWGPNFMKAIFIKKLRSMGESQVGKKTPIGIWKHKLKWRGFFNSMIGGTPKNVETCHNFMGIKFWMVFFFGNG
jgi:hypothetical protein